MNDNATNAVERPTINSLIDNIEKQNSLYTEALGVARAIENKLEEPEPLKEQIKSDKQQESVSLLQRLTSVVRHYEILNGKMHMKLESISKKLE